MNFNSRTNHSLEPIIQPYLLNRTSPKLTFVYQPSIDNDNYIVKMKRYN
ncbi:hypothetical protein yfred0001_39010 [Yersinia frederiksenii ATCC 33641]|nr:hypothetical protein yfred0001_39010 [Yersinia frederiksenii ATCC 33641]